MTLERPTPAPLDAHLLRMRVTTALFLGTVPVAIVVIFATGHRGIARMSPATLSLIAVAAGLWFGFSANRDARIRLERIKRAGAVHGDEMRLMRDHWLVYIVVLIRLEIMVVAGVVVALWGLGPSIGVWLVILGGLMMALTWPTRRKTQLLLGRVRALREIDPEPASTGSRDSEGK